MTFAEDGYYVFPSLEMITDLNLTCFPLTSWTPECYVQALVNHTGDYHMRREH
jgi:hypothetical protein